LPPNVRVAQRNMFRKQNSTIRGETNDNDHDVSVKDFTKQSRILEYIFAPCATCLVNRIRHTYKLRRSDGGPK